MDTSLFFLVNQGMQNPFFDFIMPFITDRANILFLLVSLPFLIKARQKGLFVILMCFIALTIGDATANILKHLFQRIRPCNSLEHVRLLVGCGGSFSFPSAHAVNVFAVAAMFSYFFRRAALPMLPIAVLVAFSRVYVGVHYPSDIIAGAVTGTVTAAIIIALHAWASARIQEQPYTTFFSIFLLAFTFFRYYYIATGPLDLSPDEAHYWEWSRRLDLSYYSKGPFIAYIIALTTWLMGDTVFAVRFLAPLFLALSSLFIYKLTKEIFPSPIPLSQGEGVRGRVKNVFFVDNKKACIAGLLPHITPLFATYGILISIDSPFIFFWSLSLYLFWKAINRGALGVVRNESDGVSFNSVRSTQYWVLLGFTIGFGLLTKYTMAFFYLCAFLFLIFSREQRFWLKRKELYLSFLLGLIVFMPVIVWNASHDWVTLRHTAGQANISEGLQISLKYLFEFLGSQIGVVTPLLFFAVMYGAIKSRVTSYKLQVTSEDNNSSLVTRHSSRFLFWFWAPVLGIYLLKSLQGKVQANWAMVAYLSAFIASTDFFLRKDGMKKWMRLALTASIVMAFLLTFMMHYSDLLNLPVKMDPSARLKGWKELGVKAEKTYSEMISSGSKKVFIFSDRYQVSSELAFYMKSKPNVYSVNLGRRMNQYDIWGGIEGNKGLLGADAIFVRMDHGSFPGGLQDSFDTYEREEVIIKRKNKMLRKYFIFRCYDFKGRSERPPEHY